MPFTKRFAPGRALAPIVLIGAISSLAACSGPTSDRVEVGVTENTQLRIIDGTKSGTSQDSVVYLNMGDEYCSGTLIAPNLVLTARHCVESLNENGDCGPFIKDNDPTKINVGLGYNAMSSASVARGMKLFHPTNTSACGYDIALVVLDQDIPGAKTSPVRFKPVTKGETNLLTVGYGSINDNNGSPPGRMQRGDLTILATASTTLEYVEKSGTKLSVAISSGEFATGESTCFGDSGGPIFDANNYIVGVTSRGPDQYCIDRPTIWSDTAAHEQLIRDAATAAGHPLPADPTTDSDAGSGTADASAPTNPGTGGSANNNSGSDNSGDGTGNSDNTGTGGDTSSDDSADGGSGGTAPPASTGCSATGSHGENGAGLMIAAFGVSVLLRRRRRQSSK